MTDIKSISMGLAQYIDSEIIPQMPDNKKAIKFGIATISTLFIKQLDQMINNVSDNWLLTATGLINGNNVNVEAIKEVLIEKMPEGGIDIDPISFGGVQILPKMTFNKNDINKIYQCIQNFSVVPTIEKT